MLLYWFVNYTNMSIKYDPLLVKYLTKCNARSGKYFAKIIYNVDKMLWQIENRMK